MSPDSATPTSGGPVSLIIERRVIPESDDLYRDWQKRLGVVMATWPGFIDRKVIEPSPPTQDDWVLIQRFVNAEAARTWLQSAERASFIDQIKGHFVGQEDIHLVTEDSSTNKAASIIVTSHVEPGGEDAFLAWQRKISAAESSYTGFVGHKIERPTPGVQEDWTVILTFDTDEHLEAWQNSPQRAKLLKEGEAYNSNVRVSKSSYGFGFWEPGRQSRATIFKDNLLVLLVLYPIVFLFSVFIGNPLLGGIPFWASLFIGNVVSTQLLGWLVAPWIFKVFDWWHKPGAGVRRNVYGYLIIAVLYAISMGVYALLLGV
ncbi:antibiotic biosynthesis monooxygenase [Subtercola endophyticus]|uniref:antibiotic biosynthesis monooxygenase n=1 Tax=Subtercola endophyticus TaxID=2895559 RepID=UPI001E5F3106|nr:antibiotic biosynthesis monooxygenase [Subtercola endophyticus]UFS61280.1 antibiotic biosynthesis monooxygenase [Subtercola endophyticus]